jgi:hypothetical protein
MEAIELFSEYSLVNRRNQNYERPQWYLIDNVFPNFKFQPDHSSDI